MERSMTRSPLSQLILHGVIGGIVAGIIFAIFEMVTTAMMGMPATMPLRMIGAIPLGSAALSPTYAEGTAVVAGLVTHVILSAIFGIIFVLIVSAVPRLAANATTLIVAASVYGLLLWLVNFQVIGRLLFPWFLDANQLVAGFLAHTFFYGTALGVYLTAVFQPERRPA